MPETPVDEYHESKLGQYEVRATRQVIAMKPETESRRMEMSPHSHFRLGMLSSDRRHHSGAGCRINNVGQLCAPFRQKSEWIYSLFYRAVLIK